MGKRLLIVDDDDLLRASLAEQILNQGDFEEVIQAADAAEADRLVKGSVFDMILLDVGLPDMDGRELCQKLRDDGLTAPILMLTAADSDDDTITGLDAGASDYITKPFRLGILMARVRAQLRQHEQSDDAVFAIGPYKFHPALKMMMTGPRKIRLTEKETAILKYLYRAGSKVVAREVLLNEVWGYNAGVTTHTLETHVYRLRQKIEPESGKATLLLTEGGGYRLVP